MINRVTVRCENAWVPCNCAEAHMFGFDDLCVHECVVCVCATAVPCVYSNWSKLSACDAACGQGYQTQTRTIQIPSPNGGQCGGPLSQRVACNAGACPPPTPCTMGTWSDWSTCSAATVCDKGTQHRTRPVLIHPAPGGKACDAWREERMCIGTTTTCNNVTIRTCGRAHFCLVLCLCVCEYIE
jgi:hypothetical protein